MRRIEFRAWDGKRYFYDVMVGNGHVSYGGFQWFQCDQAVVKEQFIGIKAKDGEDVYEGDMVRLDDTQIGGSVVEGEVVFNDDQTLGNLEWGIWTKRGYHRADFLGILEIIGNIHKPAKGKAS